MRVLFQTRANLLTHQGGDTVQILRTADALRDLGVDVTLDVGGLLQPAPYDILHLFHLDRPWENIPWARAATDAGVPIVVSTIWWPQAEFDARGRFGLQGALARVLGHRCYASIRGVQRGLMSRRSSGSTRVFVRAHAAASRLLTTARCWLPNSPEELEAVRSAFRPPSPGYVVPNAVDLDRAEAPEPASMVPRSGVLCVGRIEPRKNQLSLVRALCSAGLELTLVGDAGRYSAGYAAVVRAEAAAARVAIRSHQPAHVLRELYQQAAVHVCCSWYETPGLVSLEAAAAGCSIVSTDRGSARWYLADDAHYCDPGDPASILTAVRAAIATGPSTRLSRRIRERFTWANAGRATLRGYEAALR